jgi:[protein-PII] uridylyltransferase
LGLASHVSLVAVGGYGRGELSPHSDIDLLFLVAPRTDVTPATFRGLLYPLWDAGFQVGHAVRTAKEAVERSTQDLDAATAVLSARLIAGDPEPFGEFHDRHERWLKKDRAKLARRILEATTARHKAADRAGWALAPDLKDDIGGLRDLHVLYWLEQIAHQEVPTPDLQEAGDLLLAVREALHAEVKRKSDRIVIDLQGAVAARMGLTSEDAANELMSEVHTAARRIEHGSSIASKDLAGSILGGPRRSGTAQQVAPGVRLEDGILHIDTGSTEDPIEEALALLAVAATAGRPIASKSLQWLAGTFAGMDPVERWSDASRRAFLDLLSGPNATEALELLEHVGGWAVLLPEWGGVRGLAQHDPYHRYTVDGHSFIAVGEARRAIDSDPLARSAAAEVGDISSLYLGALFHDVGKGSGEDHSVAGERIAAAACRRIGLDEDQTAEVAFVVRHHLLLVDTATRRDLDDGAVISFVAETVGTPRKLRLLYILSIADGRATGPEGWNDWKGALVRELYLKVMTALETGEMPARSDVAARAREVEAYEPALAGRVEALLQSLPPSYLSATSLPDVADDVRLLLTPPKAGQVKHRVDEATEAGQVSLTVCVTDRPGTLARTAGVLALNRISVLTANAFSTTAGVALQRFIVKPRDNVSWDAFAEDLAAAYSGRLGVEARLGRKVLDYLPSKPIKAEVRVLQDESQHSTVIEVRAPDALGLLWAITASLTELDLDIHVAKIDTLGPRVVDVFYVRTAWGEKLDDDQAQEVKHSIEHRVAGLFGS